MLTQISRKVYLDIKFFVRKLQLNKNKDLLLTIRELEFLQDFQDL
jgi:hypothetical protein